MYGKKHRTFGLAVGLAFYISFSVSLNFGQQPRTGTVVVVPDATASFVYDKVQNLKLNSKLMAREMPYRAILPDDYSNSNEKRSYPVIYLLHGLSGHYDNWTDKTKLAEYSTKYSFIIVTPEGGDGWYTDSVSVPNDKYESYIVQELIPAVEKDFRTLADRDHRFIAGLSMGGYGAIKFGLKYPEKFSLVGSFSGALGAATVSAKDFGPNERDNKNHSEHFRDRKQRNP